MHSKNNFKAASIGLLLLLTLSFANCAGYRPSTYYPHPASQVIVTLDSATVVGLEVFDFAGKRVRAIAPDTLTAGLNVIEILSVDDQGKPLRPGNYLYHLTYPDSEKSSALHTLYLDGKTVPSMAWKYVNDSFPNPFSPSTSQIRFHLDSAALVQIGVHTMDGDLVLTYPPTNYAAGMNDIHLDFVGDNGKLLPAGVYFIKINIEGQETQIKRAVIQR